MTDKSAHIEKEVGSAHPIRVGISIGDVNGIGPEIIIKALKDNRILLDCTPIIYGSTKTLSYHKKAIKEFDFQYQSCKSADDALNRKVNIVNVWNEEINFELGKATEVGGKFAFLSLEAATQEIFEKSLKADFGIIRPKIAVFGVNPHAGENGKMGTEEQEVILPAINQAKTEDILAFGPFPADGFFGSAAMNQFDGVLAMYHDQGLTAFKALSFDDGVNFTAGLHVIRTSPDHGTAYDIVGQGIASAQSMRSAIYLAMDVFKNQKSRKEMTVNPLKIQSIDRKRLSSFE